MLAQGRGRWAVSHKPKLIQGVCVYDFNILPIMYYDQRKGERSSKILTSNRINKIERQNSQSHCSICQSDLYVMTLCFSLSRDCLHSPDTLKIKCKLQQLVQQSLSVIPLAKSLQLILKISATYSLVSYLLAAY